MSAELPSLKLDNLSKKVCRQGNETRLKVKSALETQRNEYEPYSGIPETIYKKVKRNSEGQLLQVKFAADVSHVTVPAIERLKTEPSSLNPVLKVDHQHYEQWARVPGKKVAKSSLLRGIQQLKAKMIREDREGLGFKPDEKIKDMRINVFRSPNKELFHINQLKCNTLLTREKFSEGRSFRFRREKTSLGMESVSLKNAFPARNQLKTNSHVIDSGVFKQEDKHAGAIAEAEARFSRNSERDSAKLRHGMSRIRDRSSLPISVYQPVNIGDHVFLVNEPAKENELSRVNKTVKRDDHSAMLLLTDKSEENSFAHKAPRFQLEMILDGKTDSVIESAQRSRATTGGHVLPSKTQRRAQFMVSSAELYDFSQLSEIRHSMADKTLERSQTELLFPVGTLRNGYKICNG